MRPPHDPAQHVLAPGLVGEHAVGDQERRRARVVGDRAQRHARPLRSRVGSNVLPRQRARRGRSAGAAGRSRSSSGRPLSTAHSRSSPMPVSTDGLGSGRRSSCRRTCSNCMNTRFQISTQRSQSQAGPWHLRPAASSAQGMSSPWWKWISLHGPQGPVSPIAQKLSLSPSEMTRSSPTPATFCQSARASSSDLVHGVDQALRIDGVVAW